jgi:uncharacterized Zn finger protein (UPF0148 family)
MTQSCCPACCLRFAGASAAGLVTCPVCGEALCTVSASEAMGLALFAPAPASQPSSVAALHQEAR